MDIATWLKKATQTLQANGSPSARLDSLVLLEDCLDVDRARLLAHPEQPLTADQAEKLRLQIKRRANHEPLAYIRGRSEFYGRDFIVTPAVLEPRPESETIIELLKSLELPRQPHIVDVGTGSGMLAITAQLELPDAVVTAVDIDPACLVVARQNSGQHHTNVQFIESDLLAGINQQIDILLCNLPYVPDDFHINRAATHEPRIAIFGGPDGLDVFRKLFAQIDAKRDKPKYILAESLPSQHAVLTEIASQHGYAQTTEDDFIQLLERI